MLGGYILFHQLKRFTKFAIMWSLKKIFKAINIYTLHTHSPVYEPKRQKDAVIFSLTNCTHLDLKIILVSWNWKIIKYNDFCIHVYTRCIFLKAKRKLVQELIILKVKFHLPEGPLPGKVTAYHVVKKEENDGNWTLTTWPGNGHVQSHIIPIFWISK